MTDQQAPNVNLPDPMEFSATIASIAERSQRLVNEFLQRQADSSDGSLPFDPMPFTVTVGAAGVAMTAVGAALLRRRGRR